MDDEGNQIGILDIAKAIEMSQERGLDLVEVAPNATPPVCRMLDFGKFKYMQKKKSQEAKKKQQTITLKEVKLRPQTDKHDLETKIRKIREFLGQGDKVKMNVFFRGREYAHPELGANMLKRVAEALKDVGRVEVEPQMDGRRMVMVIVPQGGGDKSAKAKAPKPPKLAAGDVAADKPMAVAKADKAKATVAKSEAKGKGEGTAEAAV